MTLEPVDLLEAVSSFIADLTLKGVNAPDLYIAFRAVTLSLEKVIEEKEGPLRLASLQRLAFEVSPVLHPVIISK